MLVGKEKYQEVVEGRSLLMPAIRGGIIEISRGKINGRLRVEAPTEQLSHSAKPEIAYGQHESGGRPGRGFLSRSQGAAFSGGFNRPSRNRVFWKYFKTCSLSIYKIKENSACVI